VLAGILFGFSLASVYAEPLSFSGAADMAAENSAEIRYEKTLLSIRRGAWMLGLRAYFPSLSITASEDDRLQEIDADSFLKNYGLTVEQLIFDGGKLAVERRLERMDISLSEAKLQSLKSETAYEAVRAYRNLLSSRQILEIQESSLDSLSEQRRILARELELGLALPADLADADLKVGEARVLVISHRIELKEAEEQFAEVLALDEIPELIEAVDTERRAVPLSQETVKALAENRSPALAEARLSIAKREGELKYADRSWIPTVKLLGNFGLAGRQYPLSRYNWSVGLSLDFSGPLLRNTTSASFGREPPYDRTGSLQNSFSPLPDPAGALGRSRAAALLFEERGNYERSLKQIGKNAVQQLEKYGLLEDKRMLAVEAVDLAEEKYRLARLRMELGQITRTELMETEIELSRKKVESIQAAAALLEAEQELEKMLDLPPGSLEFLDR
jgi:outer membrane protein TolC